MTEKVCLCGKHGSPGNEYCAKCDNPICSVCSTCIGENSDCMFSEDSDPLSDSYEGSESPSCEECDNYWYEEKNQLDSRTSLAKCSNIDIVHNLDENQKERPIHNEFMVKTLFPGNVDKNV